MPLQSKTRKAERVRTYEIHDNGGRPFTVSVNDKRKKLSITVNRWDEAADATVPWKHFKDYTFKHIWIGDDSLGFGRRAKLLWKSAWAGNSILAQILENRYLYIGSEIYEFSLTAGDSPVAYSSYVGNNDVPYPWLVGKTHTYLMLEGVAIPNEMLDSKRDAYEQYYGFVDRSTSVKEAAKSFRKKVVHKRV